MSSEAKIEEIKEKLREWRSSKELELLRQVVLLKKVANRENNISRNFTDSVYTDIVKSIDQIKGS